MKFFLRKVLFFQNDIACLQQAMIFAPLGQVVEEFYIIIYSLLT